MRMAMDQISTLGRATQGVRLIKLKDDQKVATVSTIIKEDEESTESVTELDNSESENNESVSE